MSLARGEFVTLGVFTCQGRQPGPKRVRCFQRLGGLAGARDRALKGPLLAQRDKSPSGAVSLREPGFRPICSIEQKRTLVLFHDSLGCAELWRDFPEKLAVATQRRVVAYDRLGFGRSDACPGSLPANFIRDEAATSIPRLCQQLGFDAMIPFGHSAGAGMAIATAGHFSES